MKISSQQLLKYIKNYEGYFKNVNDKDSVVEAQSLCVSLIYIIKKFDKVKSKISGGSGKSVIDWAFDSSCYSDLDLLGNGDAVQYLKTNVFDTTVLNRFGNYMKKVDQDLSNDDRESVKVNFILKVLIGIYTMIILSIQVNLSDIRLYNDNAIFRNLTKSFLKYSKFLDNPGGYTTLMQSKSEFKSLLLFNRSLKSARI